MRGQAENLAKMATEAVDMKLMLSKVILTIQTEARMALVESAFGTTDDNRSEALIENSLHDINMLCEIALNAVLTKDVGG